MNGAKKKAGRPQARDEHMSAAAFDALAKLSGLSRGGKGFAAVRAVIVEGMEREAAARASGIEEGALRSFLSRHRARVQLARRAVGG